MLLELQLEERDISMDILVEGVRLVSGHKHRVVMERLLQVVGAEEVLIIIVIIREEMVVLVL